MKNLILSIFGVISAIFGVFIFGKKFAEKEMELNQREDLLIKKAKANEVAKKIEGLDDADISRLVSKWTRKRK
jgi:hypothetical protein